jgi:nitrate/nitrite-specific signal transduction histidine kinase
MHLMRFRASSIGADLAVKSTPGAGVHILVSYVGAETLRLPTTQTP